jgi:hypothetical protein
MFLLPFLPSPLPTCFGGFAGRLGPLFGCHLRCTGFAAH